MSNNNSPFGLRPIGRLDGGSPTAGLQVVYIDYNKGPFFAGDPIIPLVGGGYDIYDPSGGATVQLEGIFWQCEYLSAATGRVQWSQYYPASGQSSGQIKAYIITDPEQLFVAQTDGTAALTAAAINNNVALIAGSGNTATQQSGFTVNHTGYGNTATLPFRMIALWSSYAPPGQPTGTDNTSPYNWVVLQPNNFGRKQLTAVS